MLGYDVTAGSRNIPCRIGIASSSATESGFRDMLIAGVHGRISFGEINESSTINSAGLGPGVCKAATCVMIQVDRATFMMFEPPLVIILSVHEDLIVKFETKFLSRRLA